MGLLCENRKKWQNIPRGFSGSGRWDGLFQDEYAGTYAQSFAEVSRCFPQKNSLFRGEGESGLKKSCRFLRYIAKNKKVAARTLFLGAAGREEL